MSSNLGPCLQGETRSVPSAGSDVGRLLGVEERKGASWELRECWGQGTEAAPHPAGAPALLLRLPKARVCLSPTRAGHVPCPCRASSERSPRHQLPGGCSGFPALSCPLRLSGTRGRGDGAGLRTASIQPPLKPSAQGGSFS